MWPGCQTWQRIYVLTPSEPFSIEYPYYYLHEMYSLPKWVIIRTRRVHIFSIFCKTCQFGLYEWRSDGLYPGVVTCYSKDEKELDQNSMLDLELITSFIENSTLAHLLFNLLCCCLLFRDGDLIFITDFYILFDSFDFKDETESINRKLRIKCIMIGGV